MNNNFKNKKKGKGGYWKGKDDYRVDKKK